MQQKEGRALIVSALGASLLVAGCSGGPSGIPAGMGAQNSASMSRPLNVRNASGSCAFTTNTVNFNNTAIGPGSYIWFVSDFQLPNQKMTVKMVNSTISFTAGSTSYTVPVPNSAINLKRNLILTFDSTKNKWRLISPPSGGPNGPHGNAFLNGAAYQTASGLPGGIKNVTWSAQFYSKAGLQIKWMWGAAVYTTFSSDLTTLQVKPLDDPHYRPFNNDKAGSPEAYKQYLAAGGTGDGHGQNYIGQLGHPVTVSPCL